MKDPLENALEQMKPAPLPPALMARLTAVRPQPVEAKPTASSRWASLVRRWLIPLSAGACAAVATVAMLRNTDVPTNNPKPLAQNTNATPSGLPYERNDYLVNATDKGVYVAPDHKPYRLMEVEWLEQDTVQPQADGPAIRVETKRRGVVPVALDVF